VDEAIALLRAAVAGTPPGHRDRARWLAQLGGVLVARFLAGKGASADLRQAIGSFRQAADEASAPPAIRLAAARAWAGIAAEHGEHREVLEGAAAAVELLPLLAWDGLDRATRELNLAGGAAMARDAAALAVQAGEPERVYLSACHTAVGGTRLPDEAAGKPTEEGSDA
jgi:hypothetical protein